MPLKCYTPDMNAQDVLQKAKILAKKRGLTHQRIGMRMGYPRESARQSVGQLMNSTNPSLEIVLRLAKAMGVKLRDLL